MQVILLQKVRNLGDIGDQVKVRSGYGRNFLIPQGMALMATDANVKVFESRKSELLAASRDRMDQAEGRAEKLRGQSFTVPMRASDEGKLYGSVGPQEIAAVAAEAGHEIDPSEIALAEGAIRQVGYYAATLQLHAEVEVEIEVVVAQQTDMGVNMPTRQAEETEESDTESDAQAETDEADAEPAEDDAEDEEAAS